VLQDKTIQMARVSAFNDLFEGRACLTYDPAEETRYISSRENMLLNYHEQEAFVYCLTRSPLNPVMWAHYADEHKGVVLGIDVDIPFFSSPEECVLPVQQGSIIYTKTKPFHDYPMPGTELADFACPLRYAPENLERLQRLFLYKSSDWAYEEEVRVIKHKKLLAPYASTNPHGQEACLVFRFLRRPQEKKRDANGPMEVVVRVPDLSVREIYLGCRADDKIGADIQQLAPNVPLKRCRVSSWDWSLNPDMPMGK
jgi:Protein of unknown function (DUF2971)